MELFEKKEVQPVQNNLPATIELPDLKGLSIVSITEDFAVMNTKVTNACAAMSKIKEIKTEEDDAKAEILLVKVRNTFKEVQEIRTKYTSLTDDLKKALMEPEKRIDTKAGSNSEYQRLVGLRNTRAQQIIKEQNEAKEKAAKEQASKDEKIRLKGIFENLFFEKTLDALELLEQSMSAYVQSMTLENWAEKEGKFTMTPKLKLEIFQSWFNVGYDGSKLSADDFNSFLNEVKEKMTYDKVNGIYAEKALVKLNDWKAKLPARKKELEELKALAETNAEAAKQKEAEIKQANEEAEKKRKDVIDAQKTEKANEVQSAVQGAQLDNAFEAQVATQAIGSKPSNTRTKRVAVITAPDNKIVEVMAKVMFACFTNPEFPGQYKKDAEGKIKLDTDGNKVYADWAQTLLDFVAQKTDAKIDGIEFKEIVTTVAKKA